MADEPLAGDPPFDKPTGQDGDDRINDLPEDE